ncbi:hypothetical protein TIFTF001_028576 [Ficus carica]|uniref:Uncharacterized protein n=1 Tax=Ficus carica TaxID=3494 RepID=A0AA88DQ14_FICCA|nr:hypothetical protein TIFTF001_028576 [Ficus carica]
MLLPCWFSLAVFPFIPPEKQFPEGQTHTVALTFHLSKSDLDRSGRLCLRITIYTGRRGTICGVNSGDSSGRYRCRWNLSEPNRSPQSSTMARFPSEKRPKARPLSCT